MLLFISMKFAPAKMCTFDADPLNVNELAQQRRQLVLMYIFRRPDRAVVYLVLVKNAMDKTTILPVILL